MTSRRTSRNHGEVLVIWDRESPPPDLPVLTWNHRDSYESLLSVAENNRPILCDQLVRYFETLHHELVKRVDLSGVTGEGPYEAIRSSISGRRNPWIIENFSTLARLAALELIIDRDNVSEVRYEGDDRSTRDLLALCSRGKGIRFSNTVPRRIRRTSDRSKSLGARLRANSLLRLALFLARRRGIRSLRPTMLQDNRLVLVAPLAHFDRGSLDAGHFRSDFWLQLPETLRKTGAEPLLVHWISQNSIVFPRRIPTLTSRCDDSIVLDSFLDFPALRRAVKSWAASRKLLLRVLRKLRADELSPISPHFLACVKNELDRTLVGDLALEAALQREMVRAFARSVTRVDYLVMVSENFPIESDLLAMLGPKLKKPAVLFAHSGVRPWDLRYSRFSGHVEVKEISLPAFDRDIVLAINGEVDRQSLAPNCSSFAIEVEALRFLQSAQLRKQSERIVSREESGQLRLLVLGDYREDVTTQTLNFVQSAIRSLPTEFEVVYRPHPLGKASGRRGLRSLTLSTLCDLNDDLVRADLIIASSSTSAWLKAAIAGKAVITIAKDDEVNFAAPWPGVHFVRSVNQLLAVLEQDLVTEASQFGAGLVLDDSLPKWLTLLGRIKG